MTKITAPAGKALTGEYVSQYGPHSLTFTDGVCDFDGDLPDGLRLYLLSAGYKVGRDQLDVQPVASTDAVPQPGLDAREAGTEAVGGLLRDAAVDPHEDDFLPPVNAGEADPHGPEVVSPGIHAEGERVVKSGPVGTPAEQNTDEQRLAEKLLIDNEPVGTPTGGDFKADNMGPLGLSDPLSAAEGEATAKAQAEAQQPHTPEDGEPKGNASRAEWAAYARTKGAPESELAEDGSGLSRDDLRANYGS